MNKVHRAKTQLESLGEGRFRVAGLLDASTVTRVLEESESRFRDVPIVVVDLAGVTESDSSGLALLLEWLRLARRQKQEIRFEHVPQQIIALARISEVDDLLLENSSTGVSAQTSASMPAAIPTTA
ncbi:MAG: lipid asymmetry maintenance protein MlaB [Povalibacter sp.]